MVVQSGAMTIVGGGDTDTAVHKTGKSDKISYISTGAGAFLELLKAKHRLAVAALGLTGRKPMRNGLLPATGR